MSKFSLFGYEVTITKKDDMKSLLTDCVKYYRPMMTEDGIDIGWKIALVKELRRTTGMTLKEANEEIVKRFEFRSDGPYLK